MASAAVVPFVTIDEYLHTSYEPDMDYVDGHIEERNVGEVDHFLIQRAIFLALVQGEKRGGYFVLQETRVQVSPTRFRVPDTCLVTPQLPPRIVKDPPLLCIEVMSPEDRFTRVLRKCQDYFQMGVPEVWVLDPEAHTAHILLPNAIPVEVREGSLRCERLMIDLPLSTVFARPA